MTAELEKLGAFYLGRTDAGPLLYDARDLVTHAVCVGMTGSGKTGLCVGLLEEAALDGIPAIVIDPKGDLANLLLTFPALRAEDFAPWIEEDAARRAGASPAEFAAREAERWRTGLAAWSQDGARIARLRAAADFAVYTPGSTAALPVSILASFRAPSAAVRADGEALRERVATTAASVLGLLGITADAVQSREHILLATILDAAWKAGRDLDLAALIQQVQTPPVERVGVLDVETFYPAKERFALAMALNNLLAAPGFAAWLEGEPLDVAALLHSPAGKPRVAIFSIAHLGDAERMFFVALLLGEVLAWMRAQPGTSSLRAILAMDEIAGYLPPVANPPSKAPLLTLLKQARAFGLGVLVATQNPVDLDYKALSNAGTWFVGRLQTERDRARLLDGLESAAAGRLDRQTVEAMIAGLGARRFLLHDVHEEAPVVFETRWTMSYLRGPLTRAQLRQLTGARAPAPPPPAPPPVPAGAADERPVVPPDVSQHFLPVRSGAPAFDARLVYRPAALGSARVHFADAKAGIETTMPFTLVVPLAADVSTLRWEDGRAVSVEPADLDTIPAVDAAWSAIPAVAVRGKSWETWRRAFTEHAVRSVRLTLLRSPTLAATSMPGESERDFRVRLQQLGREQRDAAVDALRARVAPKIAALDERIRRAEQAVAREEQQAREQKVQSAISIGATLLGAFLGRRRASASTVGRATTAARGVSRSMREAQDVERASETVEALRERRRALEDELAAETEALRARTDPLAERLETISVRARKADVAVELVTLAWAPYWRRPDGVELPGWE
jgi:hypothetical protein